MNAFDKTIDQEKTPKPSCSVCPTSWAISHITHHPKRFFVGLILFAFGFILWQTFPFIEQWVNSMEMGYSQWFSENIPKDKIWILIPIGFLGGLIASISPCILALLPLNLSYIGTLEPQSKREAFINALMFVLGVILVLSLMGLLSSFAGALMVDYKGYIQIVVGIFSMLMGLVVVDIIQLPLPTLVKTIPKGAGPFLVGVIFALVSSPCASPVLLAVLSASATTGNPIMSTATMASYALGYTMILFLASLLTGLSKQVSGLKRFSRETQILGSAFLFLVGVYFVVLGVQWIYGG